MVIIIMRQFIIVLVMQQLIVVVLYIEYLQVNHIDEMVTGFH